METKKKLDSTKDTIGLGNPAYWDVRYTEELLDVIGEVPCFDWYMPFDQMWVIMETFFDPGDNHRVLVVGCGRSNTVEFLYRRGFRDITAIDVSPTLIAAMQKKYAALTGVEFVCMDVKEMLTLQDNTFTIVIDKACLDALFTTTNFIEQSTRAYSEIFRVMRKNALFFSVSHAQPLARVPYLRTIRWAIDMCKCTDGENLHLFTLTKTEDPLLLDKLLVGAEAAIRKEATGVVSNLEQTMNKSSTTRKKGGGGILTVTASLESMVSMVDESKDVDE